MDVSAWTSRKPHFQQGRTGAAAAAVCFLRFCIAFEALPWEQNPGGTLHGGIIITCFDVAFGLTCHYYAKQHQITTVNLTTTFLKPVFLGDVVEYRVRITHLGRTLVSMMAEGHVNRKGKDVLIGTATATFMKLDKLFDKPI